MKFDPHPYQRAAVRWVLDHPRCCLFLDMGLGKSAITLTALRQLLDTAEIRRALVVAPKKVAESTWTDEAAKWDHLRGLRVSLIAGDAPRRREAMEREADIHVVSRDNFAWLVGQTRGRMPWDCLVIDELTSFKNPRSVRFKAMRVASRGAERVIGLTGTPAPNGLLDLWAQLYCVDGGERLGKSLTRFRSEYFDCRTWNHIIVKCAPRPGAEDAIRRRIADICMTMRAEDYLTLPPMLTRSVRVQLPPAVMAGYRAFERDRVMELMAAGGGDPKTVTAASAAALMNKLSQYANGAVYDEGLTARPVHSEKVEALAELVETAAEPVLIFYRFRFDADMIMERLKGLRARVYSGPDDLRAWNAGEIDALLAHPASTAYGLNMQRGGRVCVWYGTGWDLELYEQACARLHRQGQTRPVLVYRLLSEGTVDERMAAAIDGKSGEQRALLDGLRDLLVKYSK